MAATKVYEIADGVAITSKGVVLNEGQEVTADDFASEEVFNELVKTKKIVQVTGNAGSSGKKNKGKKDNEPSSSTGAVESEAEDTTPGKDTDGGNADSGKAAE